MGPAATLKIIATGTTESIDFDKFDTAIKSALMIHLDYRLSKLEDWRRYKKFLFTLKKKIKRNSKVVSKLDSMMDHFVSNCPHDNSNVKSYWNIELPRMDMGQELKSIFPDKIQLTSKNMDNCIQQMTAIFGSYFRVKKNKQDAEEKKKKRKAGEEEEEDAKEQVEPTKQQPFLEAIDGELQYLHDAETLSDFEEVYNMLQQLFAIEKLRFLVLQKKKLYPVHQNGFIRCDILGYYWWSRMFHQSTIMSPGQAKDLMNTVKVLLPCFRNEEWIISKKGNTEEGSCFLLWDFLKEAVHHRSAIKLIK